MIMSESSKPESQAQTTIPHIGCKLPPFFQRFAVVLVLSAAGMGLLYILGSVTSSLEKAGHGHDMIDGRSWEIIMISCHFNKGITRTLW